MGSPWRTAHANKLVTAEEVARLVKDGDRVVFSMASPINTPFTVAMALFARAGELRDVSVDTTFNAVGALGVIGPKMAHAFQTTTAFAYSDPEFAALSALDPQAHYIPLNPSFMGTLANRPYREEFTARFTGADVFVVTITPPNEAGFVTYGTNVWNNRPQGQNAKIVVGEVARGPPDHPRRRQLDAGLGVRLPGGSEAGPDASHL